MNSEWGKISDAQVQTTGTYNQNRLHSVNSPGPARYATAQRQLPACVQFYSSEIFGSVNCKQLAATNTATDASFAKSKQSSADNLGEVASSPQNVAGANKLGPILLDLRYLRSPPQYSVDGDKTYRRQLQPAINGQAFAISRGEISASAGTVVSSTCLSFQKRFDIQGNPIHDVAGGTIHAATGLTTGALCIHTFKDLDKYLPPTFTNDDDDSKGEWSVLDSSKSTDVSNSSFSYYQPRHHRLASSVAWRPGASNSRYVAIGLLGSSGAERGGGQIAAGSSYRTAALNRGHADLQNKDRDCCALVWDVEATSTGSKQVPVNKLARNAGVASLAWISDGQLLAVGCTRTEENLQIYDLRIQGTSSPPLATSAHDKAVPVHGIAVNSSSDRSHLLATFSRVPAEPVKLWDERMMTSCVAEIKIFSSKYSGARVASHDLPSVSSVAWDPCENGMLGIASGDTIRYYDTRTNQSRPALNRMTNSQNAIQSIAFQPPSAKDPSQVASSLTKRMLVAEVDGSTRDLALRQDSAVAISSRDGRISTSVGSVVWVGETTEGPSAMESTSYEIDDDISKVMMRRSRCLHIARYSTDASLNLRMISEELKSIREQKSDVENPDLSRKISSLQRLWRLWSWIERVEDLCSDGDKDERRFPSRGLQDAGMLNLLRMNMVDSGEMAIASPLFNRDIFDSVMRRNALIACGWDGKFGIKGVLDQIESHGQFERSAALSVWNSNIGEAVSALQRGAEYMRTAADDNKDSVARSRILRYAETLELVAMCIAGYSGANKPDSLAGEVWKNACESLLKRLKGPDLIISKSAHSRRGAYLQAVCSFLINVADENGLKETLNDEQLCLSDRCAFATKFLSRSELEEFLHAELTSCIQSGNLEGILITGLDRNGISLLQSYIDASSDVQTAALVSSRVILPRDTREEKICTIWLEAYREMLNKWQMWQSRALFDVGRAELHRTLRARKQAEDRKHAEERGGNFPGKGMRRHPSQLMRRQPSRHIPDQIQPFPPQLLATCGYCNTPLPLSKLIRRQDGLQIANDYLDKQNPVLSCCPNSQCKKPLPRCAICLLPLGCLNPLLELKKLKKDGVQNVDDLSELSSLKFEEWFTWCMRCKHGGHSHHMIGWFSDHDTCPVSGCDCKCQFDGIQKLKRIGLEGKGVGS